MTDASGIIGATPGDLAVRRFGVVRLALPVPFVEAGGTVNAYLIEAQDGSLTLFDAGIGTDAGRAALAAGVAATGRRLEDVRTIVLSHGHVDHFGGARAVVERAGATVHVHPRDAAKVAGPADPDGWLDAYGRYFARLGVPADAAAQMGEIYRRQRGLAQRLAAAAPLAPGATVAARAFTAAVVPTPGHTPGHVCLHSAAAGLLFTGDHLLARISPNPLLELGPHGEDDKFRALDAYLESARLVATLAADWILPGHGAPFTGHREVLTRLFSFHERRQAKLAAALADGPKTPYELVQDLFGRTDPRELFLMLSEVVGNLEVLEDRGRVVRVAGAVPYRYRGAASALTDAGPGLAGGASGA